MLNRSVSDISVSHLLVNTDLFCCTEVTSRTFAEIEILLEELVCVVQSKKDNSSTGRKQEIQLSLNELPYSVLTM